MRTLRFLLKKEFLQIFRNRTLLGMILVVPILQLLILPLAADYQVKNIQISIVDHDLSLSSQKLIAKIAASAYFNLVDRTTSYAQALDQIEGDRADIVLEIPRDYEAGLVREGKQQLFMAVNAINGMKAGLGAAYLQEVIRDYHADFLFATVGPTGYSPAPQIQVVASNWYNPHLEYSHFMVPGILAVLVTMVCTYMCALNIVREKEEGTIEQVNVTPIKKHQFILGKLIPFWIIGMLVFTLGLFLVARPVYGIVPLGSLWLLYAMLSLYLIAVLGIGLLISTYSGTQQQAMSLSFFFVMIFMLMSGLFTPVESMPPWAMILAKANPVTHFIEVLRMVVLKGSDFDDLRGHFMAMIGFGLLFNLWAILNYRKIQ